MNIEFVSNPRSQSVGFQYFVTCINPGFDINSDDDDIECSSPPGNKTYSMDAAPLVTTSEVKIVCSLKHNEVCKIVFLYLIYSNKE